MVKIASVFDDDFLLETETARVLYHEHAARQPIFDYHCHLSPELLAHDYRFVSVTELWLKGDHYKWRAMRADGVPERLCTGTASDWEKFAAWASVVPHTLRNPLHHWTHLELKRPFGIRRWLDSSTAADVFRECNCLLRADGFSTHGLLRSFNVAVACTTDDPTDTLEHHSTYAKSRADGTTRMYPTWRPDRALAVETPSAFNAWLMHLAAATGSEIRSFENLLNALEQRHTFFHEHGCRLSDHGIPTLYAEDYTLAEVRAAFGRALLGQPVVGPDAAKYKSALLYELALMDYRRGWAQQYHVGALRNTNTRMLRDLGPDVGGDSIGDHEIAQPLARFLDRLDCTSQLTKTILYNLNPRDNEVFAAMAGSFQDGTVPGKIQYGTAWWFLDQLDGMEKQLNALSNQGLLSRFVGMVTDSRSFLSYSRHEYFRRLLCDMLGREVERGRLPGELKPLGELVRDVCFGNACDYFGLPLPEAASSRPA
ncbi:glucuronate isomerase [Myxococcota bacterium]